MLQKQTNGQFHRAMSYYQLITPKASTITSNNLLVYGQYTLHNPHLNKKQPSRINPQQIESTLKV